MIDLLLYAETDDRLAPPMDRSRKPGRNEELARLDRKADDIRLCLEAAVDLVRRQEGRLQVLMREIDAARKDGAR